MFVSLFFPVYLVITATLFFLLPGKWRPALLLAFSYFFCGWLDVRALAVLILFSFFTWGAGLAIEGQKRKGNQKRGRNYLILAAVFGIGLLCIYKYVPGLSLRFGILKEIPQGLAQKLVMPVGLSFYLFQAIGYLADIYQGKSPAEKNFLYLGCYLAFFPKLVSGPIEREEEFLPQIKAVKNVRFYDRGRLSTAFTYMLWGYFMKMVVADRLAVTVNQIFDAPEVFDSFWLAAGALLYTLQIYCDFAGYSYIAVGCAGVFGIRLTQNFRAPYCASGITDFWRRWHVSLSTWLRDYLYIPLGGNRKGMPRKCMNTMIVFLVCGMWHGSGVNFIAWGLLHGIYSVVETLGRRAGVKMKGGRLITFLAVAFAWIFFRASSFGAAAGYIGRMVTAGLRPEMWRQYTELLHLNAVEIAVILAGILVIWLVDELCCRKKLHLPALIQHRQNAARYLVFYMLIVAIFIFGMYGPGYHAEQFIYMQF